MVLYTLSKDGVGEPHEFICTHCILAHAFHVVATEIDDPVIKNTLIVAADTIVQNRAKPEEGCK